MSEYPEHDKLHAIHERSQAIGEFLEWLNSEGVFLCREHEHTSDCYAEGDDIWDDIWITCDYRSGEMVSDCVSIEKRLAAYFDIDLKKIAEEKDQMLDAIRSRQ